MFVITNIIVKSTITQYQDGSVLNRVIEGYKIKFFLSNKNHHRLATFSREQIKTINYSLFSN